MKDECDINCCCEEDCSSQDKQMFSYCSSALLADSLALSIDYRHCYRSHFLYDNNTKLLKVVKQNSHNLFCIAIDNLEPGLVYKTLPLVKSVKDFNKMLKRFRKGVFSWPESQHIAENAKISTSQIAFNLTEYKADDYIWMFMENTTFIKPLFLPASSSSILFVCNEERPVLYLKNSAHSCLRRIPKSKTECEKTLKYLDMYHFYKDYKVLSCSIVIKFIIS
ncbi:tectonic-1-like [Lycorma delicatula]|uniref:tectonic-1-like n=1 Tax=Lycorma delicatula TaxID=130591 RepID=UPI003F51846F